jgi:uncharacterized protein
VALEPPRQHGHAAMTSLMPMPTTRTAKSATAFVGRTLRGPLNTAVVVKSLAEYHQVFGGLWQPSPLSYAVEHFFEQGGRDAVIVRVANGATPVTISLPCGYERLRLEAKAPGTREFLRASVDYDHVLSNDDQRFNLVIQRVRTPGSERIEEQEIFRGLSVEPASPRFVAVALLESNLVRVSGAVPTVRPDLTLRVGTNLPTGYINSLPDGHDGAAVTDYDVIGSAAQHTGLFALDGIDELAFVYVPPLSRTTEIGVSTLLIAAKFCHERRAILIVDPLVAWESPADAVCGLRELEFHSEEAVMFFPRIQATDRLRGRIESFGNGGAVAGMLSGADEDKPVWSSATSTTELWLRGTARPQRSLTECERLRLEAQGINVLNGTRPVRPNVPLRTLTGGAHGAADWGWLATRRLAFFIVNSVERGTRWVLGSARDRAVWLELSRQVNGFFDQLYDAGAFPGRARADAFSVVCDERINKESDLALGSFHLLVQFASVHSSEHHAFLITHAPRGSRVRRVHVNPHNVATLRWTPSVVAIEADDGIPVLKVELG